MSLIDQRVPDVKTFRESQKYRPRSKILNIPAGYSPIVTVYLSDGEVFKVDVNEMRRYRQNVIEMLQRDNPQAGKESLDNFVDQMFPI